MFSTGLWLSILGGGSFILNHFGMEFKLLMLLDMFGPSVGNGIRIGLIALGAVLMAAELLLRRKYSLNEATELHTEEVTSQSVS